MIGSLGASSIRAHLVEEPTQVPTVKGPGHSEEVVDFIHAWDPQKLGSTISAQDGPLKP